VPDVARRGRASTRTPPRGVVAEHLAANNPFQSAAAFAASGAGAPQQGMPGMPGSLERLLIEQNRLLQEQLFVMQQQREGATQFSNVEYLGPSSVLGKVDPETRKFCTSWQKGAEVHPECLGDAEWHQGEILQVGGEGEAPSPSGGGSQLWLAVAEGLQARGNPLEGEDQVLEGDYDVAKAWLRLRRKHAADCMEFIKKHQLACFHLYDSRIQATKQKEQLTDKLEAWFAVAGIDSQAQKHYVFTQANKFVELALSEEFPNMMSRLHKEEGT